MRRALIAAFAAGALAGGAGLALAQAQAQRQLLGGIDVAGTPRVARLGTAVFPPGAAFAAHTHPGEEISYVIEGEVIFTVAGHPPKHLQAGDSFAVPRDTVHQASTPPGKTARVVAVWVVDQDKPLATPVR
jgi:quercetin dioxygenase-like cupin family protein